MNTNTVTSTSQFNSNALSSSWQSGASRKYAGMIETPWIKETQQQCLQLYSYIHNISPNIAIIHILVSFLRIAQIIIPSLQPCEPYLWGPADSQPYQTISYLTVVATYLPLTDLFNNWLYILIVIAALKLIMIIMFYFSSKYYSKNAVLPTALPIIFTLYISTIGILFEPPCWNIVGKLLGDIIFDGNKEQIIAKIVLIIINVFLSVIYFYLFISMNFHNLEFHDFSLQTVLGLPQELTFLISCGLHFSIGISSNNSNYSALIFIPVMSVLYLALFFIGNIRGGYVKSIVSVSIKGAAITGMAITVFELLYMNLVGTIDLIMLWVGIIVMILIMGISFFAEKRSNEKILDKLDLFLDDPKENTAEVLFRSPSRVINAVVTGFSYSHPACIDWSIFLSAAETWPKDIVLWTIFAKFAAIYPSEVSLLTWIFHTVKQNRLKGSLATTIKQSIISIMRQRESTLTPDLKNKIETLTKSMNHTKLKLRHVWDAVIQGNTGDVEVMSKAAIKAIDKLDADLKHLVRQFPNNRFVTRVYTSFLRDLMADHDAASKFQERSKLLCRGISVVPDEPHELALKAFPTIPERVKSGENQASPGNDTTLQITMTEDIIAEDNAKDEQEMEQLALAKKRLQELTVPTTRNLIIARIVLFFCLLVTPAIYFITTDIMFPSSLQNESSILETIAVIRNYNSMCPLMVTWYIYETMGILPEPHFENMMISMEAFDQRNSSYDLVNVMLQKLTANIQTLEKAIGTFEVTSEDTSKAYEMLSTDNIKFDYYYSYDNKVMMKRSVQTALLTIVQSAEVVQTTAKDKVETLRNGPCMLNPMFGSLQINIMLNNAMDLLIQNSKNDHNTQKKTDMLIMVVFIIAYLAIQIIYQILEIKFLVQVKVETYKSLIALPKNVVSQVAEQLRMLKKEGSQSEQTQGDQSMDINKQEENILKVFTTSGSNAAADDVIILTVSMGLICLFYVVCCFKLIQFPDKITYQYVKLAPHIHYFIGSIAMRFGAFYNLLNLAIDQDFDQSLHVFHNYSYWYEWGPTYLQTSMQYMNQVRFGGTTEIDTPFEGYAEKQAEAYELTGCTEEETYQPWKVVMESIRCVDPEGIQLLHNLMIIQAFHVDNYSYQIEELKDDLYTVTENANDLRDMYATLIFYLYDNFYFRAFYDIIPEMQKSFNEIETESLTVSGIMIALAIVAEIVHVWRIKFIEKHIKDVLHLLLHCPVSAIFQTPKIMEVLNGNFSPSKHDMTNRNEKFFRDVVECVPDAYIIAKTDFTIIDANGFCEKLLGKNKDSLVEKSVYSVFEELKFTGDSTRLTPTQNQAEVLQAEGVITRERETANVIVEMSHVNNNLVYVIHDTTQTVRYNTLIEEERKKSDSMLASILPQSLVKRVQAGEQNISFSVQSATVLFLDVVSFTPWCGSHDAKTVMDTLNLFFKKLDYLASTYPTITKIKCIGDCYMCAGGIFMEVNQPTEHAREVVSFGLDALDALQEVNKEMDQDLQIRVGINSGGPLVAGVLGVGKPTFEILGPVINVAQQMEHHGVPSKVHVSRSVYELIYGDSFSIKERGTIEVKQGSVVTYIVDRKK